LLFNSHIFIFIFLPVVFVGFFLLARVGAFFAASWLTLASFFFYGWWSPKYVLLLLLSIAFNFLASRAMDRFPVGQADRARRHVLIGALIANLALLAYYKYANFFLDNLALVDPQWRFAVDVTLPLGISFFTFTQIAFLVDAYRGRSSEPSFVHYCLFVTYFPHLIAGPVLHHSEMMPQFRERITYRLSSLNVSVGLTIFAIGLFKKVVIADSLAPYANAVFDGGAAHPPTFLEAWAGALAYTFQLYFDFSGYSDMAIGLSRMFNVTLPLNFNSPYRAANIIDFWRRWHMTLSRFLRDYVYIPLGGSRRGSHRRYVNLMLTMVLGGMWHGAGWTFIVWGGLHGIYLVINHAWRWLWSGFGRPGLVSPGAGRLLGRLLTFLAVVVGWVFFRSDSMATAVSMLDGMAGLNGVVLQDGWQGRLGALDAAVAHAGVTFGDLRALDSVRILGFLVMLAVVCVYWPNTQELLARFRPALDYRPEPRPVEVVWSPNWAWGAATGLLLTAGALLISRQSEFLYFQF